MLSSTRAHQRVTSAQCSGSLSASLVESVEFLVDRRDHESVRNLGDRPGHYPPGADRFGAGTHLDTNARDQPNQQPSQGTTQQQDGWPRPDQARRPERHGARWWPGEPHPPTCWVAPRTPGRPARAGPNRSGRAALPRLSADWCVVPRRAPARDACRASESGRPCRGAASAADRDGIWTARRSPASRSPASRDGASTSALPR